jgi:hypothetical protein
MARAQGVRLALQLLCPVMDALGRTQSRQALASAISSMSGRWSAIRPLSRWRAKGSN